MAPQAFTYPYSQKKLPKTKFVLIEELDLPEFYPTVFAFFPHDILWAIKVNGHEVNAAGLPLSAAHHEGRNIDLAPYLQPGINRLELSMEVIWGEGDFEVAVSPWDKYSVMLSTVVLLATTASILFFCLCFRMKFLCPEMLVLVGGIFIRYLYLSGTPYFVRAYDYWGHIDYLHFVSKNLRLPDPHSNWEAFQPPLYYVLVGGLTKIAYLAGIPDDARYSLWQGVSLLCSAGVLIAGVWIGRILYEKEPRYRLYLLAVLSVAPALVLNASRVTNDLFLNLLEFVWLGLLLQFWRRPTGRSWLGLSCIVGLAMLAKASALVLIPISLLCLLLVPRFDVKKKIAAGVVLAFISFAIAGWYYVPRAFHEEKVGTYLVGNLSTLTPKAHINHIFLKSFVFNPFKVIRYPLADPWGPRHEFFPEVFFKTIFLGEWISGGAYKWIARLFIVAALLLVPPFLIGAYRSARGGDWAGRPLLIAMLAVFAAQWCFLQIAPFISSQDFRYSVILLIPMVYFFLAGADRLSPPWKSAMYFCLQLVLLNAAIYVIELALSA